MNHIVRGRLLLNVTLAALLLGAVFVLSHDAQNAALPLCGAMLVMSGSLAQGPVMAQWPGLDEGALDRGEDLAITTDYRDVLADLLTSLRRLAPADGGWLQFPDRHSGCVARRGGGEYLRA